MPYALCIYDGSDFISKLFITNFNNYKEMIIRGIISIMKPKYHNYCVNAHNLSDFDGVFLFNLLYKIENTNIKPLFKDGKFLNIDFIFFCKYNLKFRDSLLMLPVLLFFCLFFIFYYFCVVSQII
jgi:hypothetical protein